MKRIISTLLVLCMVLACVLSFTPAVFAADELDIGFGGVTVTGLPGETVDLVLRATNNPGFTNTTLLLTYDKAVLELVAFPENVVIEDTENTGFKYYTVSGSLEEYPFKIMLASDKTFNGDKIAVCKFKILENATGSSVVSVTIDPTDQPENSRVPVPATSSNATVKVSGAIPADNVAKGDYDYYDDDGMTFEYIGAPVSKIVIPEDVTTIEYVLGNVDNLSVVVFPATFEELVAGAFEDIGVGDGAEYYFFNPETVIGEVAVGYIVERRKDVACEDVVIHGWSNSTAQAYATANEFEFVPLEEFTPIGAQNAIEGRAVRVISQLRYTENYSAVELRIVATGADDGGAPISKQITKPISTVYRGITGTTGESTFTQVTALDGFYLSAVAITNLPEFEGEGYITFTITPVVTRVDEAVVELPATTFTYTSAGYVG